MKNLNKIIFIATLISLNSVFARIPITKNNTSIGSKQPRTERKGSFFSWNPSKKNTEKTKQIPVSRTQSVYKNLHKEIIDKNEEDIFTYDPSYLKSIRFKPDFIAYLKEQAKKNKLQQEEIESLLETARDKHIPIGKNDYWTFAALDSINGQTQILLYELYGEETQ
jgi:hypothetical protein